MRVKKIKVLVSAGGTGGHIIPAVSVCNELIKRDIDVYYIGNKNSMEADLICKVKGIKEFYGINVQKLYRSYTIKHFLFPFKLLSSILSCINYIKIIKPDAFIGFGGFVSGAPAIASYLSNVPVYLQEQNCNPGITNKITGFFAKKVFLAYKESFKFFKKTKCIYSGNPVNISHSLEESFDYEKYNLSYQNKKLLVLGGSQGSLFINNLILENMDYFINKNIDIIWQTGKNHLSMVKQELIKLGVNRGVFAFDFSSELNKFYHNSDFVISRGGALSLAEVEIYRLPAFVIPLPSAAVNEQYYNALSMEKRNLGVLFEQKDKQSFQDRFDQFLGKCKGMYPNKKVEDVIHLKAAKIIVDELISDMSGRI